MNHLQAGLVFAGIPLAVFVLVIVLVFTLSKSPPREEAQAKGWPRDEAMSPPRDESPAAKSESPAAKRDEAGPVPAEPAKEADPAKRG